MQRMWLQLLGKPTILKPCHMAVLLSEIILQPLTLDLAVVILGSSWNTVERWW